MSTTTESRAAVAAGRWGLVALYGFTALAVVGYGVFGLHPELLPDSDSARWVYQWSFPLFGRLHIAVAGLALAVPLFLKAGGRWLPALAAVYAVSFLSEFVGTGYGLPFGEYAYTGLLGWKLGGRVPALIPLSWFLMAVPSYALARRALPGAGQRLGRILMSSWLLVTWDLTLDPAMSWLTPYWTWGETGAYYGMPMINLVGWFATGLVLMLILEALKVERWTATIPARGWAAYYGAVLLMPLGMVVAAGLWLPVVLTAAALALPFGAVGLKGLPATASPRPDRGPAPAEGAS